MYIDNRMQQWALDLSIKHQVSFDDALQVLMFFNGFMLHNVVIHADLLIASAVRWGIRPPEMINHGLEVAMEKIRPN